MHYFGPGARRFTFFKETTKGKTIKGEQEKGKKKTVNEKAKKNAELQGHQVPPE